MIDDGSPDRSGEICDKYARKDSRIRVFHQQNGGVSRARNNGLAHAQGQYVVFVDSDDRTLPDYLCALYQDVCTHRGVGLVIHGAYVVNVQGEPLSKDIRFQKVYLPYKRFGEAFTEYGLLHWGFPWSKIYDKAVLDAHSIRFDEDIHHCEDILFMLRYLFFCDYICFSPTMNYKYVQVRSSLSHGQLHSFKSECKTFVTYLQICRRIVQTWKIPQDKNMQMTLADSFQRALKTDYQSYHQVRRQERIAHLRMLTDVAGDFLQTGSRFFAYKIDWLGGLLLKWRLFACYDRFISLMFRFPVRRFLYDSVRASGKEVSWGL